jgi:LuxR family transcriptional regulator, maltose regulon positive regulatory protein
MAQRRSQAEARRHAAWVARGHEALARNAWDEARAAFDAALAGGESAEALEGLGMAAWWLDDGHLAIQSRERAYRLHRARGDRRAAGRIAAELAEDHVYFHGQPAVARGWLQRAHRLLDDLDLAPEHGWLRIIEGDLALSVDREPERAQALAAEAASIARQLELVDLELLALALEGLSLVMQGRATEGLRRLDEVGTAALSGEMSDPVAVGYASCYVVTGCARARDFARATEWCARAREFSERTGFSTLFSVCRAEYAAVLIWRGAWADAERELTAAAAQLEAAHPALQADTLARLAELRRRQGRYEEAAGLLRRAGGTPRGVLEGAALALDRGDPETAAVAAERFVRRTPASDIATRLEGLEVWLRAALALGDRPRVLTLLSEIRELSAAMATEPVRATTHLAEGLAARAEGDHQSARRFLEDAVDAFGRCGATFEQARAQLDLARELAVLGKRQPAAVEAGAARDLFERLGAQTAAADADALRREYAGPAAVAPPSPGDLTPREVEVLRLVAQGLHNRTIAERLFISDHTVKRHVANILTKLDLPSRAAAAAFAARQGLH